MAVIYVDSNASGGDDGSTWADAYSTRQKALTTRPWATTDVIWEAHDHAETSGSSVTWTATNDTLANVVPIYRVNSGSDLYDNSDATVNHAVTGSSPDLSMDFSFKNYGSRYSSGDNIYVDTAQSAGFVDCHFTLTSANGVLGMGGASGNNFVSFENGSINFSHATGGFLDGTGGAAKFKNVDFLGNAHSGGVIKPEASRPTTWEFESCDFTAYTSDTLIDASSSSSAVFEYTFRGCSLASNYVVSDSSFTNDNQKIRLIACDIDGSSNAKRYKNELHTFRGIVKDNITTYRDASTGHEDGSAKYSFEMTSGENGTTVVEPWSPLEGIELQAYISSTGSKTFTVEGVENFTSALNIDEAWMEVYYLGTAT